MEGLQLLTNGVDLSVEQLLLLLLRLLLLPLLQQRELPQPPHQLGGGRGTCQLLLHAAGAPV